MATKQSLYEWRKSDKPSTAAKPLSPQMHKKASRLAVLIGDQELSASIQGMPRFSVTDLSEAQGREFKAKLLKLKAEYVKHPSHRRKVAWVKSIDVLMDRFASQEEASKDGKPVAKPKASKAKKAKKAKPEEAVVTQEGLPSLVEDQIAQMVAKAVEAALAAQA